MSEWPEVRLGESLMVHHGWAFKGEFFAESGEMIVVTPGNFYDKGGFKSKIGSEKFYLGQFPKKYVLPKGAVVVAMTEQSEGLLGSTATIPEDSRYLHNQRIGLLQVTEPQVLDLRFACHLMNAPYVRRQIQATATGSKVRHTAPERIRDIRVALPGIGAQRLIAALLDTLDEKLENNQRRIKLLEEMARAIYREWFVKFRYPGHSEVQLVDSVLGPIPEDWKVSTCESELNFIGGGTPSKGELEYWDGGDIAWYTPTDLTKTGWRYAAPPAAKISQIGLDQSSARLFPQGSVMMTSRATLGVLAIATTQATTNQGFIVVLPDDRWSPGFIYEWLASKENELAALGTGATFKEITKGSFKIFPFTVPTQPILNAYRETTEPIEDQIRVLEQEVRSLSELRDLLLPRLVSGRIDISKLDLNVLLEGEVA